MKLHRSEEKHKQTKTHAELKRRIQKHNKWISEHNILTGGWPYLVNSHLSRSERFVHSQHVSVCVWLGAVNVTCFILVRGFQNQVEHHLKAPNTSHRTGRTDCRPRQTPMAPPQLIGSPMAVPWSVWVCIICW